jgi:hypothetical protein
LASSAVLAALLPMVVPQTELPARLANLAYSTLDVIALAIAIPAFVIFMKGTFWRPFLVLVFGVILALVAQVLFAIAAMNGTYYPGHVSDLIYDWGFLSAALGFYLRRKQFLAKSV